MARIKLSEEEKLAKKKARAKLSFSDAAYKHYDTSKGFGSADEWIRIAEALLNGRTVLVSNSNPTSNDLAFLFLSSLPDSAEGLKKAYRNSMFKYHPDHGGTDKDTIKARDVFERLLNFYN